MHARLERGQLTRAAVIRFAPRSCFLSASALRCYFGPLLRRQPETGVLATTFRSPAWDRRLRLFRKQGQSSWPMTSLCPRFAFTNPFDCCLSAPPVSGFGVRSPVTVHLAASSSLAASVRCQLPLTESTPPPHSSLPSGILLPRDRALRLPLLLRRMVAPEWEACVEVCRNRSLDFLSLPSYAVFRLRRQITVPGSLHSVWLCCSALQVGGQAVLGRQNILPTPWLTERHGYDPTC